MPLLDVQQLSIEFHTRAGVINAANNINFQLDEGETLAIVGESGSGKSVTCYSMLGILPMPPAKITSGAVWFKPNTDKVAIDLLQLGKEHATFLRSQQISIVFQDPGTSLNPYLTIGEQLMEPLLYAPTPISRADAKQQALQWLDEVNINNPQQCFKSWSHQLSGGMRQRVMIAMALIGRPKLLIADEPTTALDVTIQAQILELLSVLQKKHQIGVIFISHDLSVVSSLADNIIVMEKGRIVEKGTTTQIFHHTQHDYTKKLIAAIPKGIKSTIDDSSTIVNSSSVNSTDADNSRSASDKNARDKHPLIQLKNLTTCFKTAKQTVTAVNNVSLNITPRQIIGLVGESGSGKSTLGRTLLKLVEASSGEVIYAGQNLCQLNQRQMKILRKDLQMVFQDPFASLNPRMTLYETLVEPLLLHEIACASDVDQQVNQLLDDVGLSPTMKYKYAHEFSGGQRQRIAIARAIATRPKFIVADEPVSALDVTIQAQILELMQQLVERYELTMLFISHDLAVVKHLCHRTLVMYHGEIVEDNSTEQLFTNPQHDYTKKLIQSIPKAL